MAAVKVDSIFNLLSFNWLTGPIFDKELRVSSRRKRNYAVRFAYIALLTITMVLIWIEEVRFYGNISYRISRMARAGIHITMFIAWFQFVAAQIIAGVMLSTSISDEIYHKTLGTLMTTPITSFQIVTGKLLSKLLQTLLLIAISFPLLSVVRVFGGIPWDYVVSSLCITMSTVIFVGSLSMFYSIFTRRAYVSIILTILTLAAVFLLVPVTVLIIGVLTNIHVNEKEFFSFFAHANPYITMTINTVLMESPRGLRGYFFNWPLACGVMLAGSAVLVSFSVALVRKVALRQATGQPDIFSGKRNKKANKDADMPKISSIRRVTFSPVLWKETCSPLFGKRKILFIIAILLSVLIILGFYAVAAHENALDDEDFHVVMAIIFFSVGLLFTIILPANCITSEKESRSWHLLLATTLTEWQIVFGKIAGAFRRCFPSWCYLFAHIIIFTLFGFIHPLGLLQTIIIVFGVGALLTGSGLYFSTVFKRTTTAVIVNFIFAAVLWAGIPFFTAMVSVIGRFHDFGDFVEVYCNSIPYVQAAVSMDMTANGFNNLTSGHWLDGSSSVMVSTMLMVLFAAINSGLGLLFAWRAKCRFRTKIF